MILTDDQRGATFSPDRKFRYRWWDIWDTKLPPANLLMLNPSTADENKADPTLTRQRTRVSDLGYGGLIVTNAYALRSPYPRDLITAGYPIGQDNDAHIVEVAKLSGIVICGWGQHIQPHRAVNLLRMIRSVAKKVPHALSFGKSGQPGHPLYLPYEGCPPMVIAEPNFCMGCGCSIAPDTDAGYCGECGCEDDGI